MEDKLGHVTPVIAELPAWDETAALEAIGGNAELARELINAFVEKLPGELSELRSCFKASDWALLTETAHRMRGATSYCGVPALDACLRELESTSKTRDRDGIAYILAQTEQESERLTRALGA